MNENKNTPLPCHVVRDLLPLYHDGVVSAETRSAVGEHLMGCESCRAEYAAMAKPLPEQAGASGSTLDRFRALMRRQKRKKILAIVLAAVLAVAATAGIGAALSQWYIVPVSADEFEVQDVCLIDTPEGEKAFVRWTDTYGGSTATRCRVSDSDHTVHIEMKHPVLEWVSVKGHERSDFWFVPVEGEIETVTFNGETVWTEKDETREAPGYARAFWDWDQAVRHMEGGAAGYTFADDYVYLLYPDGREEYWSYDGRLLDAPPASPGLEMDWSLELPPPAAE